MEVTNCFSVPHNESEDEVGERGAATPAPLRGGLQAGSGQATPPPPPFPLGCAVGRAVGLGGAVTAEGSGPSAPSDGGVRACARVVPRYGLSIPDLVLSRFSGGSRYGICQKHVRVAQEGVS